MKQLIALACMSLLLAFSTTVNAGPQQEKMKMCNKNAKEQALKGAERKAFMKDCLSNKTAAPAADKKAEATPGGKKHSAKE